MAQQKVDGSQLDNTTVDASTLDGKAVGSAANEIVALDGSARLPAVDGSLLTNLSASGGLIDRQIFTSSGTWNKPAGISYAIVTVVGGGGGAASAAATATTVRIGGAGASGAAIQGTIQAADLTSTETVTVGFGGAGQTGTNLDGNIGNDSSFGTAGDTTQIVAKGGFFGSATTSAGDQIGTGGSGSNQPTYGAAFTNIILIRGGPGHSGFLQTGTGGMGGSGGSPGFGLGVGGRGDSKLVASALNGSQGSGYGCGAPGTISIKTTTNAQGLNGLTGIVIVDSYA